MHIRHYLTLSAAALCVACAPSPDSIAPVSMAGAYDALPCGQAQTMLEAEMTTLAALEPRQNGAVTGDAIGVLLIGVPVSSLTGGDVSGEIAASKGKVLALQARLAGC